MRVSQRRIKVRNSNVEAYKDYFEGLLRFARNDEGKDTCKDVVSINLSFLFTQ
jgi:hypothetical protein